MSKIDTLIFDLDGLLVDTTDMHYAALSHALNDAKVFLSREQFEFEFLGVCTSDILDRLEIPDELRSRIQSDKKKLFEFYTKDFRLEPKVLEAITELYKNYTLAIASNNNSRAINILLKDVAHYFKVIVSKDDVVNPKPEPDVYLKVLEELDIRYKSSVLVFEDSDVGFLSATRAGLNVIGMNHATISLENILKHLGD